MADSYWISDGVQQAGPYPRDELPSRGLRPDALVWAEGMPEWRRADEVDDLLPLLGPAVAPDPDAFAPPEPSPHVDPGALHLAHDPHAPAAHVPTAALAYQPAPVFAPPSQAMAITSFVLGLAGFFVGFIASILAIIFGHIALARINRGEEAGRGFAIAGLLLGYILLGLTVLVVLFIGAAFCGAAALG